MKDMDDIVGALAKKYGGGILDDEKKPKAPPPVEAVREYSTGYSYSPPTRSTGSFADGTKLFPSERMALRHSNSEIIMPKRPQVLISTYSDDELEWMFETPAKRGWEFKDWLEVIGLPRDLHEKHDASIYGYASRAFLRRKQESHQR